MDRELKGRVALVTGGSYGVGKGIAEALSAAGAIVYVTGRSVEQTRFQGTCIAVRCDHMVDTEVEAVFERMRIERTRLDILVNNVWGGYERMVEGGEFVWTRPFWTQPIARWDSMFGAGVRAHYVASGYAAHRMVQQGAGLIVNLSYWAGQKYIANVAYGVAKAATDRMTADMAHELRNFGVAVLSLYPGLVRTEKVMAAAQYLDLSRSESPWFVGRAVAALAADTAILSQSGSVVTTAGCAARYGFTDLDGSIPPPLTLEQA